jgi:hypothetical protein
MEHTSELNRLQLEHGFDRLTAWRHMRDRAILRRRFAYQQNSGACEYRQAKDD